MNCDTYLAMLETLPVEELGYGAARQHAANCHDCNRVTLVVVERERSMLMAFNELYPPAPAGHVAARALDLSRRRRIASYFRTGLGVAMAVGVLSVVSSRMVPRPIARLSETFPLQCLAPDQAAELLRLTVSPSVSVSIRPSSPLGVIRVVASPAEMRRVRSVLDRYDTPTQSQCGVQLTVPKAVRVP